MESTQFKKTIILSSPPIKNAGGISPFPCAKTVQFPARNHRHQNRRKDVILRCAKEGGGSSPLLTPADRKRLLEEELNDDEEFAGIRERNENCGGLSGLVESLECLEREAIMGDDEGIEAMDYNRRAMIFDRSSKVFQALKEGEDLAADDDE